MIGGETEVYVLLEGNVVMVYVFGDYTLDMQRYELRRAKQRVALEPKAFDLLVYLVEHRDRVITRHELLEQVWPDRFISDHSLTARLRAVREALGEDARKPRFIETVHGRGYRFVSPVEADDREAPDRRETAVSGVTSEAESRLLDSLAVEPETPPHLDRGSTARRRLAGERKRVTVLSGALANAVTLAERLGLESLPHLRQRFLELVQQSVEPYDGTFQSVGEDGFQVLFGVPVAQEDHARRAVQAALSLQQRLWDADVDGHSDLAFAVRLGAHTGAVMVGSQGDEAPRSATVVGEVTTVAEQLQHRAASGGLLVSEDTLRLLHGNVRHEAVGTFAVPGQMTPLVAFTVHGLGLWRAPMMWRHAPALSRFVGRERELTVLQALLAQTEQGQGHVVGIMGEPGMGKSRLLYEFARHFPTQVTYLEGHCLSYGSATPYLPVLDILRQLGGIMEADSPATIATKLDQCIAEAGLAPVEKSPYLRQLLGVMEGTESLRALSPQGIKRRTFATLHQLVLSRSQQHPLVLAIENLHWIDSTSQEWLLRLVEHLATTPLLLLTTYRPGYRPVWMDKSYATQLALIRLTPEDSQAVVQSVLQRETLPEDLLHEILTRAAGNPFFLEELTRAVVEREDGQPSLEVPDSVQAVLTARMDRLPLAEKGLLQTASVIGNDVPIALLQAVTDVPESGLNHALQHLQAAEFLYETQSEPHRVYTFKHALTQDVAYQSLLLRTRQRLHQEIAQVLEEHFPETAEMQPEVLAHHYTEAGLHEPAVGYWQRAGEQARSHAADIEAIAHFRKGLEVLTTLPATLARMRRELDLYILLALAYTASKGQAVPEVEQAYVKARELCEQVHDDNQLFRALIGLTRCYGVRSQYQKGEKLSDALLQVAQRTQDPRLLMEAHMMRTNYTLFGGAYRETRNQCEQALTLYERQNHHVYAAQSTIDPGVNLLSRLSWALWCLGYPAQALARTQELLTLARELGHVHNLAMFCNFAALTHQLCGEAQAVDELTQYAMQLSTEHGFYQLHVSATIMQGWLLATHGQQASGLVQMQQGLAGYSQTGNALYQVWYLTLLAEAYRQHQQSSAGLDTVAEAIAISRPFFEPELYRLKGELLLMQSWENQGEAEACFDHALALARRQQAKSWELRTATSLARLWQRQGKRQDAYDLLAPVYNWFTEGFDTADLQEAKALLAELGTKPGIHPIHR